MQKVIIRQGDVLLQPIEDISPELVPAPLDRDGSATLAHGEATGHRHRLEFQAGPDGAALSTAYVHPDAASEVAQVRLLAPQALVHEEHLPHALQPGAYRVSRPYEYAGEDLRRVED